MLNAKRGRADDEEESPTGECDASVAPSRGTLAASGGAEVRGGPAIHALHSWPLTQAAGAAPCTAAAVAVSAVLV